MTKLEKRFQEHFNREFKAFSNQTKFGHNTPAQEFKRIQPEQYNKMFDEWYDEVHPY